MFLFNRANKGSLTTEKLNIIIEENRWVKQMYMLWVTDRTTDIQNRMTCKESPPLQFIQGAFKQFHFKVNNPIKPGSFCTF